MPTFRRVAGLRFAESATILPRILTVGVLTLQATSLTSIDKQFTFSRRLLSVLPVMAKVEVRKKTGTGGVTASVERSRLNADTNRFDEADVS